MVRTFIVDDEAHNREVLKTLLKKYSHEINIIGEADNADDAISLINELKPQLVFLDIKMPTKNGFELLKEFKEINFEVIFVTAYNEFAINAFELNAIGYILKPIDSVLLYKTVDKAERIINSNNTEKTISNFVQTLNIDNSKITKISVHHHDKVVFIGFEDIIQIDANNGYCEILAINNNKYITSKDLKMYENVFKGYEKLFRVNKSTIINISHIKNYTKGEICFAELVNGSVVEVSRRKKGELLQKIKSI